jgi:hypothetical protein
LIKYERLSSPTIKDTLVPALQKNGYLDEKGLMAKWDDGVSGNYKIWFNKEAACR